MRVLVTNDDGVESPGIKALASALVDDGDTVTVFAPMTDRSGAGPRSASCTARRHPQSREPIARSSRRCGVRHRRTAGNRGARCVPRSVRHAARAGASGIDPGQNTGHLVLHSGTVGATLTAAGLGVPGLAVSLQFNLDGEYCWETAATYAAAAVEWVAQPDDSTPRVLNINVPNVPVAEVNGVREAELAAHGEVWVASADVSGGDLKLEFEGRGEAAPGTDVHGDQGRLCGRHAVVEHQPQGTGRRPGSGRSDRGRAHVGANSPEQLATRDQRLDERSVHALDSPEPASDTRRNAMT